MYAGSGVEHSLVNQLLTEMDGFRKEELVFVVATTNFVESLDPALLRPGRFEYQIHIPYPDRIARQKIIEIYARHFNMSYDDICLEYLLERTGAYIDAVRDIRYSGDHLYGIARQLKRLQARRRDQRRPFPVTCADIDEVMGPSLYRNPQKRLQSKHKSAYHEAGHALAAALLLEPQAIHKVTIAAEHPHVEGMISIHGYVSEAASQSTLLALIQIALAGRTAEQMIFGQLDIGAKNDLDFATELARMMVEDLGMSEQFGPRVYRLQNGVQHAVGGVTRERIDNEINQILITQSQKVAQLLEKHAHHLEQIAKTLLSNTEIDGQQLAELLNLSDPTTTNTE
jgi:cell division protease FtsH